MRNEFVLQINSISLKSRKPKKPRNRINIRFKYQKRKQLENEYFMSISMMNFKQQGNIQKQQSESVFEITRMLFPNCTIMNIYRLIIIIFGNKAFGHKNYGAFLQDIHNVAIQMDPSIFLASRLVDDGNINIENDMNTATPSETPSTQIAPVHRSYNNSNRTQGDVTRSPEACATNLLIIVLVYYYFDYTITIKLYFLQAKSKKINKKTKKTQQSQEKKKENQ